jgi:hypothetical protein
MEDRRSPLLGREESLTPSTVAAERAPPPPFHLDQFQLFLNQLVPLLIGATQEQLDSFYTSTDFSDRSTKWAQDPNAPVLYLVKQRDQRDEQPELGQSSIYSRLNQLIANSILKQMTRQPSPPTLSTSLPPSPTHPTKPPRSLSLSTFPPSTRPSPFRINYISSTFLVPPLPVPLRPVLAEEQQAAPSTRDFIAWCIGVSRLRSRLLWRARGGRKV